MRKMVVRVTGGIFIRKGIAAGADVGVEDDAADWIRIEQANCGRRRRMQQAAEEVERLLLPLRCDITKLDASRHRRILLDQNRTCE